jgi:hypothetical protein
MGLPCYTTVDHESGAPPWTIGNVHDDSMFSKAEKLKSGLSARSGRYPTLADTAPSHAKRPGKFRTPRARTGYKDIFPDLNVPQYSVVEPLKSDRVTLEYEKLYCSIFKHC